MERAPSKCILCNSSNRNILIQQGEWTVYKCADCGLGFLDPRPDQDELQDLYRKDYFSSHYDEGLKIDSPEMKRRISQEDHRIKFFRNLKRHGKVLDIGCAWAISCMPVVFMTTKLKGWTSLMIQLLMYAMS